MDKRTKKRQRVRETDTDRQTGRDIHRVTEREKLEIFSYNELDVVI